MLSRWWIRKFNIIRLWIILRELGIQLRVVHKRRRILHVSIRELLVNHMNLERLLVSPRVDYVLDNTLFGSVEGVISPDVDVLAWLILRSSLFHLDMMRITYNNIVFVHFVAADLLRPESFTGRTSFTIYTIIA